MKSMAQLEYHYGLKVRIYPSDLQKQIIKVNSDASRFVYNEMVAIGKELWQLNRIKLSIDTVQDRIQQLKLRQNAKQMSNHFQFLEDKRIDSLAKANAIQNYYKAWLFARFMKPVCQNFIVKAMPGDTRPTVNIQSKRRPG